MVTGGKVILIVEDEAITAILYSRVLTQIGYQVCKPAATGEEAIHSAETERPDIILMDINLIGDLDGVQAAEKIRENNSVPIIFITGYSNDDIYQRALRLDPAAYLTKPLTMETLKRSIRTALA
jgi:two-component system, response regulator PdtaR